MTEDVQAAASDDGMPRDEAKDSIDTDETNDNGDDDTDETNDNGDDDAQEICQERPDFYAKTTSHTGHYKRCGLKFTGEVQPYKLDPDTTEEQKNRILADNYIVIYVPNEDGSIGPLYTGPKQKGNLQLSDRNRLSADRARQVSLLDSNKTTE